MLTGDNGILKRATDAKVNSDEAQIKERIQLAYHSALIKDITGENGELTKTTLQQELDSEFKDENVTITDNNDKTQWIVSVNNVEFAIIKTTENEVQTNPNAPVGELNQEYIPELGKLVKGYTPSGVISDDNAVANWRLFYADNENAYIIGDRIGGTAKDLSLYKSDDKITDLGKQLNSSFTNWNYTTDGDSIQTSLNTPESFKIVSYFTNPANWEEYKMAGIANWVVGAPSIEMFAASYNATHLSSEKRIEVVPENSSFGYYVKWSTDDSPTSTIGPLETAADIDKAIYCNMNYNYVLCSPHINGGRTPTAEVSVVAFFGRLACLGGNTSQAIRPLVSIPLQNIGEGKKIQITDKYFE